MTVFLRLAADHLWQSTLFVGVVALLALVCRRNRPQVRHGFWLAASAKFLVPVAALVGLGQRIGWRSSVARPDIMVVVDAIAQPFSRPADQSVLVMNDSGPLTGLPPILLAAWLAGSAVLVIMWWIRWRRIAAIARHGDAITDGVVTEALRRLEQVAGVTTPMSLVASTNLLEPGVFGIRKPVLLWPTTLSEHLNNRQVEAIIAHELAHVRRRDNLAAALHMTVEALFWFHPVVWWIGARLIDERERACDADSIRAGSDPQVYAESLLKVAEAFAESPLPCVAGVTGSNLKQRIERIMTGDGDTPLSRWAKLAIATAGVVAIVAPTAVGILNTPPLRAQVQESGLTLCGAHLAPPLATPPVGSAAVIYLISLCFESQGGKPAASPDTYLRYIRLQPSRPSINKWVPYDDQARGTIQGDYRRLWDSGLLSYLTIDVRDYTFANGVVGKVLIYNMREIGQEATVYTPGNGVSIPKVVKDVEPTYTPEARKAGIQGTVMLSAVVLSDGTVGDVTIHQSLDPRFGLDRQAVDAAKQWVFNPGTKDGRPVDVRVSIELTFDLKNSK